MDKLTIMSMFMTIVEHQGLGAAARTLNVSPASVSTKLKALEAHYGVKLLNRTTRVLSLTDEGERFYQLCKSTLDHVQEMENAMFCDQVSLSGNLRISAPRDLGKNVIAPMLELFIDKHPKVSPHLILTDDVLSIYEHRLDVVFRYGHLEDSQLISRHLSTSRRVLCASPDYLVCYGVPKTPEDLSKHHCIGAMRSGEQLTRWTFYVNNEKQQILIHPSRLSNDGEMLKRWALDGKGIALKSWMDIEQEVAKGQLVVVLDDYLQNFTLDVKSGADLHLIYPSKDHMPSRTRAFVEFTTEYFHHRM